MITIGSDTHLKTSRMTVLNHDGKKLMSKTINNHPEELLEFVRQFPGPKQFSIETTYNWPVMYDLLKDEFEEFHLLHAKKLKSIVESQSKCDKKDADEIARLTHTGYIPKAYAANPQTRAMRRLLRTRVRLSQQMTGLKNVIHSILNANIFYSQRPKNFKDVFCKRGLQYLEQIRFPEHEKFVVESSLNKIKFLDNLRDEFDKHIETIHFHSQDLMFLQSVPAMRGKVIKYIVLAEIDNIHRFKNSDSLIAYAGLIPRDRSSGGKNRKGRLRTECNQFLKWAMIQAVAPALFKDLSLRDYYQEVKKRSNASSARVAVARKLLRAVYHVLKEHRPYYYQANRA
jgi:transposase